MPSSSVPAAAEHREPVEEGRLRYRLLLQLRWASVVAQVCVVAVSAVTSGRLTPELLVVGAGALVNLGAQGWMARRERVSDSTIVGAIIADILVLTALLAVTGGPVNPFTLLYMVHVATASVALSLRGAIVVACVVVLAYSALFLPAVGVLATDHGLHAGAGGALDEGRFAVHMRDMWLEYAIATCVIVAFVGRLRAALEEREARVAEMRENIERNRRLGALATLAGGAAHELATPLATIGLVAGELQRRFADHENAGIREDIALLLAEVERCRSVLMQLATDAGTAGGEAKTSLPVRELVSDIVSQLPLERIRVNMGTDDSVRVPRRALSAALRGLVKNSLQADAGVVEIDVQAVPGGTRLAIVDHGAGMDVETLARVGEPFFTTKEPGEGMGLGVFLARALVEQIGGSLLLTSSPGAGTRAEVTLPAQ
jgi:two-component system sensor histidine kinase RegB